MQLAEGMLVGLVVGLVAGGFLTYRFANMIIAKTMAEYDKLVTVAANLKKAL